MKLLSTIIVQHELVYTTNETATVLWYVEDFNVKPYANACHYANKSLYKYNSCQGYLMYQSFPLKYRIWSGIIIVSTESKRITG